MAPLANISSGVKSFYFDPSIPYAFIQLNQDIRFDTSLIHIHPLQLEFLDASFLFLEYIYLWFRSSINFCRESLGTGLYGCQFCTKFLIALSSVVTNYNCSLISWLKSFQFSSYHVVILFATFAKNNSEGVVRFNLRASVIQWCDLFLSWNCGTYQGIQH